MVVRTPQQFKEKQDIDVKTEHRVTKIDPKEKRIEVHNLSKSETQWFSYDKLIIATGARSRRLNLPGSNAKNIFTLKDLQDGIRIREYIDENKPKQAAILGGGFIALEMCEAFRLRDMETFVFCRRDLPAGNMEREISEKILKELQENGVHFLTYQKPIAFHVNSHGEVTSLETDKVQYPADMVLMAVGVIPNVEMAQQAGVEIGETGAIRTDLTQKTNFTDIYTAGDCCEVFNLVSQDWVHTPLGDIANKQGRVAGENAAGGRAVFQGVVGSAAFKVFELEVAFTGLGTQVARQYGFDVDSQIIEAESKVGYMPGSKRMLVKLIFGRRNGRLLGAQMAGKEGVARRINTLAVALHQKMAIDEIARLDFAYAPPFSAPFDPILIAAEQATKKLISRKE
ncbi:MAG: FAD-dependent oxidoreductase [Thermodesulfobacteriota bacterium]|nr:FAD-dependent oxidoreductase [Thermodesulfobacteriota bacterium]